MKDEPRFYGIRSGGDKALESILQARNNPTHWSLNDALIFIRKHQQDAMDAGYYLALAGGVLNNGSSDRDLDLVAVPRSKDASKLFLIQCFEDGTTLLKQEKAGVTDLFTFEVDGKLVDLCVVSV